jgi:hypothetical protein
MDRMSQVELRVALEHYRELLSQAEAERLARRLARHGRTLLHTLRVRLGEGLIALGRRLAPQVPPSPPQGDLERGYRNSVL